MRTPFTGAGTALITPFTSSGAVDEGAVKRLARRQIDGGMQFLVPCGTTGETPTLSHAEKRRIIELVVEEANGAVPVMAGAGGYDTKEVVHTAQEWERLGVDGILSVTPYYNKPTPEGLYEHYKAIANGTTLPIMLYNVPGRTGCNMDAATIAKLATIPSVIGVKEATANISQLMDICQSVPSEFLVLSGDDACTVPFMSVGGHGLISVASNEAPAEIARLVEACEGGDYATARRLHRRLMPLMTVNFTESNPGPVKFAMAAMGLCENVFRLPMVPPRQSSRDKVLAVLRDLGMRVTTDSHASGMS